MVRWDLYVRRRLFSELARDTHNYAENLSIWIQEAGYLCDFSDHNRTRNNTIQYLTVYTFTLTQLVTCPGAHPTS
jgi:hypothetical protein